MQVLDTADSPTSMARLPAQPERPRWRATRSHSPDAWRAAVLAQENIASELERVCMLCNVAKAAVAK